MLQQRAIKNKQRILCIMAHPDDEVFVSGTTQQIINSGGSAMYVYLTDGQKAIPNGSHPTYRRTEMMRAAEILGLSDLLFWGFPDGDLATQCNFPNLVERINDLIQQFDPTIVTTFPPNGITYHPDHIVAHYAVKEAFNAHTNNIDKGTELWYFINHYKPFLTKFRKPWPHAKLNQHNWVPKEKDETFCVDVCDVLNAKTRSLYEHKSQRFIEYLHNMKESERNTFLGTEYYHAPLYFESLP